MGLHLILPPLKTVTLRSCKLKRTLLSMTPKTATGKMTTFGWKGVGFQCGVCFSFNFNSVQSHISFTVCGELMMGMYPPKFMRKSPPELLTKDLLEQ